MLTFEPQVLHKQLEILIVNFRIPADHLSDHLFRRVPIARYVHTPAKDTFVNAVPARRIANRAIMQVGTCDD